MSAIERELIGKGLRIRRKSVHITFRIQHHSHCEDVFSIGLETRCTVGTESSKEIHYLRTCDEESSERPIETQCLFVAEIPAGAETKEREAPPVSVYPEPKDRIRLLLVRRREPEML